MRFESIEVVRYGCLADLSTGEAPLANIVVVLGPNESGKSTLFDLLATLLYGFRPATRDAHPFTPWAGGDAEGSATIRMDRGGDGSLVEVNRRLRSTPKGRLKVGEREEDIRNQPVPGVEHVTRVVFRQVYALTLAELAGLERESWDLVQDRLVGAMAAPDLVAARTVAEELERQATRLWRPDRRGRPHARTLSEELTRLRERRRDALHNDRLVRDKVAERAEAERRIEAFGEEGAQVESVAAEAGGERVDERTREQAAELFEVPPDEINREALAAVPLGQLRDRVREYRRAREERRGAEERLRGEDEDAQEVLSPGRGRLVAGIVLFVVGVAVAGATMPQVGLDLPVSDAVALRTGAVASIAGFVLMLLWGDAGRRARHYHRASRDARKHLSGKALLLKDAEAGAHARVAEIVSALPLRESLLATPDLDLPAAIERMLELLDSRDRDATAARREDLRGTIARLKAEIAHLQEGDTPDQVEGRIDEIKRQIRKTKEGRDRAFVLARVVREADRHFRYSHQPDLLLRAGSHLRHITAGRYERLEIGDAGDEALYLSGPAAQESRKVGQALSQGTREQVYMALRLAIIDHLDAGEESLPLFMDETLVNWDAWRRDRAFGLLERVARKRQVFVFTCHPAMAAELEDRGARIIALTGL